jgi:hypothetical protein
MGQEDPKASDKDKTSGEVDPGLIALIALDEVAKDTDRTQVLVDVFSKHLDHEISGDTYDDLTLAVSALIPPEMLALLTWASQPGNDPMEGRIAQLNAPPDAEALVRRLIGLFGPRLSRAMFAAKRPAPQRDDWLSFTSQVMRDVESKEYAISSRIEKFNGESFFIEGDPISMTRFARQALRALVKIGDPSALETVDFEQLSQEWGKLQASFSTEAPEESTEASPD